MIIKSLSIHTDGRNYINGQPLTHFVWNHYHPDDPWRKGFVVHHKDEDTLNDHISNLELLTISAHITFHRLNLSEETRQKMSMSQKGNKNSLGKTWSKESKAKMSERVKKEGHPLWGKHHSEETKQKMSLSMTKDKNPFYGKKHSEESRKRMSEFQKRPRPWAKGNTKKRKVENG